MVELVWSQPKRRPDSKQETCQCPQQGVPGVANLVCMLQNSLQSKNVGLNIRLGNNSRKEIVGVGM